MVEDMQTRAEKRNAWGLAQIARAEALLANPYLPAEMRLNLERVAQNLRRLSGQPSSLLATQSARPNLF